RIATTNFAGRCGGTCCAARPVASSNHSTGIPRVRKSSSIPVANTRLWQSVDERLAVIPLGALGHDQQVMGRRLEFVIKRLMSNALDIVGANDAPIRGLMLNDRRRSDRDKRNCRSTEAIHDCVSRYAASPPRHRRAMTARLLCHPAPVVGWGFPGDFAKRGRK